MRPEDSFSKYVLRKAQKIEKSCFVPYTDVKMYKVFVMYNKHRMESKVYTVIVNKKLNRNG